MQQDPQLQSQQIPPFVQDQQVVQSGQAQTPPVQQQDNQEATQSVVGISQQQIPHPTTHNPQPISDPAVDQVVQQGMALHDTLSQPALDASSDTTDVDILQDEQNDADELVSDDKGEKNPLDMLEEILGKGEQGKKAEEQKEELKEPEKTPEEIEAERRLREEQEKAAIDAHRQQMMQEVGSDDQKKRDQIRTQQSDSLKTNTSHVIRQLQHKKIMVQEN